MREHVLACAVAVIAAGAGFSQTGEWQPRIDEGLAASAAGEYSRAAIAYRAAAQIADRFDPSDVRRLFTWNCLGAMYDASGRFPEAGAAYHRALKAAEESRGISSPEYALILENLATLDAETGQYAGAEKLSRKALAIQTGVAQPDELRIAIARDCLAEIVAARGKYREAEDLLNAAVSVLEARPDAWSEAGIALNNLGYVCFHQRNYPQAERLLLRALATFEHGNGLDHPILVRTLNNLGSLALRTGRPKEAGERFHRALDIAERRLGPDHPIYAATLANYAFYLRETGEKSRAKELEARSSQILRDSGRRNGLGSVIDVSALQHK